jgi:hypothetical protein
MNSNWTLRFPRTSREAYGYQVTFRRESNDRAVLVGVAIGLAFLVGLALGGWV